MPEKAVFQPFWVPLDQGSEKGEGEERNERGETSRRSHLPTFRCSHLLGFSLFGPLLPASHEARPVTCLTLMNTPEAALSSIQSATYSTFGNTWLQPTGWTLRWRTYEAWKVEEQEG